MEIQESANCGIESVSNVGMAVRLSRNPKPRAGKYQLVMRMRKSDDGNGWRYSAVAVNVCSLCWKETARTR